MRRLAISLAVLAGSVLGARYAGCGHHRVVPGVEQGIYGRLTTYDDTSRFENTSPVAHQKICVLAPAEVQRIYASLSSGGSDGDAFPRPDIPSSAACTTSDADGFYRFSLPVGPHVVCVVWSGQLIDCDGIVQVRPGQAVRRNHDAMLWTPG